MKTTGSAPLVAAALLAALCAPRATAQFGTDPQQAVRKILDEVSTEMSEIDRLLLESSRNDAAAGIERNVERMQKLIDQTQGSQEKVVRGIDRLIEELQNMAQQSRNQQQSQSQDRQQQPQDSPERRGDQTRQQTQQPDYAQQPRDQQQQQQQQQGRDQQPRGNQDTRDPGQNTRRGTLPDDGTERVEREQVDGRWGSLPKYLQFLHTRGGEPAPPPKYRRLLEAYIKRSAKQGSENRDR